MALDEPLGSWPRLYFKAGGGNAHLFYKIHGSFLTPPQVSRAKHRTNGVPEACSLQRHTRHDSFDVLRFGVQDDGYIAGELRSRDPGLFEDVVTSEECLVLRGEVPDPGTLDYFRDAVGLVTALLDAGGTAVFDPHMFKWWSAHEWREHVFEPAGPVPRHHVVILVSDEAEGGGRWYHTRGMIKFGRPDLSIHNVPADLEAAVEDLCNRFIEMQAFGAVITEGQEIRMESLPSGWSCRHGGGLDDPEFNNRHVAIGPG